MLLRAFIVWIAMLGLAVGNGIFRESILVPRLGSLRAGQVSTLLLCALILALTFRTVRWIHPVTIGQALVIGAMWVVLTLIFEFGSGLAQGKPMRELLADYDVLRGRIWPLVLVTLAVAPLLMSRARGMFGDR
jgi:hypothetical protein